MRNPYSKFHSRLKEWYAAHGRRDLPWRNTRDPYAIYISEIMLQQTQVSTVLARFYPRFLKQFPTLASLAQAEESEVLKAWEGLGYYSRARNLHKAAKQAARGLPDTVEELMALPGIGRNTAHAIATFAFRRPVAVMEANVKRVLHRLFARETMTETELWEQADALLDRSNAFDFNQAMMDLGATICTSRRPRCDDCPASIICKGKHEPERYPTRKARKPPPVRRKNIVLFHTDDDRYYLEPRDSNHLGGLYGFPEFNVEENPVFFQGSAHKLIHRKKVGEITVKYSHFTLLGQVYRLPAAPRQNNRGMWIKSNEINTLNISRLESGILKMLK